MQRFYDKTEAVERCYPVSDLKLKLHYASTNLWY